MAFDQCSKSIRQTGGVSSLHTLRGEAGPNSDIDLIVELTRPVGLDYFRIENDLSEKLGAKVEMTTEDALTNRIFRRSILADAVEA